MVLIRTESRIQNTMEARSRLAAGALAYLRLQVREFLGNRHCNRWKEKSFTNYLERQLHVPSLYVSSVHTCALTGRPQPPTGSAPRMLVCVSARYPDHPKLTVLALSFLINLGLFFFLMFCSSSIFKIQKSLDLQPLPRNDTRGPTQPTDLQQGSAHANALS